MQPLNAAQLRVGDIVRRKQGASYFYPEAGALTVTAVRTTELAGDLALEVLAQDMQGRPWGFVNEGMLVFAFTEVERDGKTIGYLRRPLGGYEPYLERRQRGFIGRLLFGDI